MNLMKTFIRDNFTPPKCKSLSNSDLRPRLEYVDLAKGICIIMVVVYHCPGLIFIPSLKILRMPLYFFLSGMFFKSYDGFRSFVLKKVNNLLIPCAFFEILYCCLCMIVSGNCSFEDKTLPINNPLWFLFSLFAINILFYFIHSINNSILRIGGVLLSGLLGYVVSITLDNPLYLGTSLTALPIFYMGYLFKQKGGLERLLKVDNAFLNCAVPAFLVIMFCLIMAMYHWLSMPYINYVSNTFYGNGLLVYIFSGIAVVGFMYLCKKMNHMKVISYCGRYSIIILGTHMIAMDIIVPVIYDFFGYTAPSISLFLMTMFISWLAIPFFRKYFPYFTAQKNLFEAIRRRWAMPDEELAVK